MRITCFVALAAAVGCGESSAPYADKDVDELIEMLQSTEMSSQVQGAFGLSRKGREAHRAVPALLNALDGPDPEVRRNVVLALGKIKVADEAVVRALTQSLGDSHWMVQRQAALALGELGPDAKQALPELEKLTRQAKTEESVREACGRALRQIRAKRE